MLSDKSPVWTHDETVGHIRNVNWNEPKQRLVWHCREVAANSNISVRLALPQCLKLYLILRAVRCDAIDVLQAIVCLTVALDSLRKLRVTPSAKGCEVL